MMDNLKSEKKKKKTGRKREAGDGDEQGGRGREILKNNMKMERYNECEGGHKNMEDISRERKSGREEELKGKWMILREKDREYENPMCRSKWMNERARSKIDCMELQIQLCIRRS